MDKKLNKLLEKINFPIEKFEFLTNAKIEKIVVREEELD